MSPPNSTDEGGEIGRPRKELDLALLRALSEVGCSIEEMAAMISRQSKKLGGEGINWRTVQRRLNEEIYREAWEEGVLVGKATLRVQMVKQGKMMNGAGVHINQFIAINWLGMRSRQRDEAGTNTNDNTITVIVKGGMPEKAPEKPSGA